MGIKFTPKGFFFFMALVLTGAQGAYMYTFIPMFLIIPTYLGLTNKKRNGSDPLYQIYVWLTNLLGSTWWSFVASLLETLYNVRISYMFKSPTTGKMVEQLPSEFLQPPPKGKFNIIMMNHRTRIDWLLIWPLLARAPKIFPTFKIVPKSSLMKAPFFGWVMQGYRFLFLYRDRTKDDNHISDVIQSLKDNNEAVTYLVFPEGSDLSDSNIAKSQAFAEKNGLPKYFKVLNPRTTGMIKMKNAIGTENIHNIIDITLGYTDFKHGERPADTCLIDGRMPRQLHYLCSKYSFNDSEVNDVVGKLPTDDDKFSKWIEEKFMEKETTLSKFYSENPVDFEPVGKAVQSHATDGWARVKEVGYFQYVIKPFFLWVLPTLASLHKLFIERSSFAWVYLILTTIYFVVISNNGGLDIFFLRHQRERREKAQAAAKKK